MEEMNVKVLNGSVQVLAVDDAARMLKKLGMKVGEFPEALGFPFEIDFPFAVSAHRKHFAFELKGSHAAIRTLQRMVNNGN